MLTALEFRFTPTPKLKISPYERVQEGLLVVDSKWRKSLLIFLCINFVLQFSFLLYKHLKMCTDYEWKMVYNLLLLHWIVNFGTIHTIWILRLEYVQLVNQALSWNKKFGMNCMFFFIWLILKFFKKFQVDCSMRTSLIVINFGRNFSWGLLWIQRWRLWDCLFLC